MSEISTHIELAIQVERTRLAGEDGFVPLRPPTTEASADTTDLEVEPVRAEDIRPGMRRVDGEWLYSAAWL